MKTKLLFWGAILFLALGLSTKEGMLFYFFAIHLFMLFIGAFLHQHEYKPQPQEAVKPPPDSPPTKKNSRMTQ
jgi:hypothetical protein